MIGHNVKNQSVSFFFHRCGETISYHFYNVLNAILMLEGKFIKQADGIHVQPQILHTTNFFCTLRFVYYKFPLQLS